MGNAQQVEQRRDAHVTSSPNRSGVTELQHDVGGVADELGNHVGDTRSQRHASRLMPESSQGRLHRIDRVRQRGVPFAIVTSEPVVEEQHDFEGGGMRIETSYPVGNCE